MTCCRRFRLPKPQGKKICDFARPDRGWKDDDACQNGGARCSRTRKKVGFITTDTYRIAAIDQLKTYAHILHAPFAVCYNADDFRAAKRNLADCDLVFVDTAGRNFRNPQYVAELQQTIEFDSETETLLVLAATGKYDDMKAVYDRFSGLPLDRLIITKLDETDSYGAVFNLLLDSRLGAAYFTNGQNVPDDMMKASADRLVQLLFGAERW